MNRKIKFNTILVLFGACVLLPSCNVGFLSCNARYDRDVELQETMELGGRFTADTSFGNITINGAETNTCHVSATIRAWASTEEQAQELAEETVITLEKNDGDIEVRIDRPKITNCSIGVSLVVTLPKESVPDCSNAHGNITIADIDGDSTGRTSFGSINCRNITGNVTMRNSHGRINIEDVRGSVEGRTSFGSIDCTNITGDVRVNNSHGRINIEDVWGSVEGVTSFSAIEAVDISGDSISINNSHGRIRCVNVEVDRISAHTSFNSIDISAVSDNASAFVADVSNSHGSIDFNAPSDYAGRIQMTTSYGSLKSDLPITISGDFSKDSISGSIGEGGSGNLDLKTSFGSIELY